jgi:hypothetical protein
MRRRDAGPRLSYVEWTREAVRVTQRLAPTAAYLARLKPADPCTGALGEQLDSLRAIRAAIGTDTPIAWIVFRPVMAVPFLRKGRRNKALETIRCQPKALAPDVFHVDTY